MPRTAKRTSQTPSPGLPYGQGVDQARAVAAVPLPSTRANQDPARLPAPQPQRTPAPAQQAAQQAPQRSAYQAALAMPSPGMGLLASSQRPGEPATVGMSIGPGPGPEVLRYPTGTTATLFSELALVTGDPWFNELARKAGVT